MRPLSGWGLGPSRIGVRTSPLSRRARPTRCSPGKRNIELHQRLSGYDRVEHGKHLQGARAPVDGGVASTRTTAEDILAACRAATALYGRLPERDRSAGVRG